MSLFLKKKLFNSNAFSLIELLSAAAIMATLSVVGIKSYQSQVNKARSAEAQKSLSYLYSSQQAFYNNWNTYHENLFVVGMLPDGQYNYDVGFTVAGHKSGGDIGDYPSKLEKGLDVLQCSTFNEICEGNCITEIVKAVKTAKNPFTGYFSSPNCEVIGRQHILVSNTKCGDCPDAKAEPNTFKAIATEKLRSTDVWSINEKQQLKHEEDGT